jgi:hypothetical protein
VTPQTSIQLVVMIPFYEIEVYFIFHYSVVDDLYRFDMGSALYHDQKRTYIVEKVLKGFPFI